MFHHRQTKWRGFGCLTVMPWRPFLPNASVHMLEPCKLVFKGFVQVQRMAPAGQLLVNAPAKSVNASPVPITAA
jgi:hypothetical protein